MPMNPSFLCCIGAELKNSTQQTTRMSQIYFYRAFEEQTVADMLQPGFFNAAIGIVRKDDLLLLYDPKDESARWTYCRVSNVDRSGVEISLMGINAKDVLVEISGEDPITLQSLIDNTIMPAIENIGDMDLPVITEGSTAPTNLSEAIRQIVTQNLTLSEDSVEPQSGQFSLWGAIKKALGNAKNFFSNISNLDTRLNALEGQGGPVGSYDFGKSFPNILDATDTQLVAGVMVDNIWAGHTPIVWTTPIANSTFTDGDGVDRTVGEIFNGTWIINSYDGTRIVLTNTPNTTPPIFSYQNVGVYSVGFANATTAGVVRVGTGSDMTVDQITGDISIDNTKGYSIFHRLISLFTGTQQTQIREDLNAASRDMDDLSATGQNIANWSSNITDGIVEIQQTIYLDLTNGTLTLKSGSKVYVPNGAGTFDLVTISNDLSATWGFNDKRILCYKNGTIGGYPVSDTHSGPSAPSGSQYMTWYDTTNNVIKQTTDGGSTWDSGWSLPICVVTTGSGVFASVDQTFNGFGYIGSTMFVLPGVKYLLPDSHNQNGTFHSIQNTTTKVSVATISGGIYNYAPFILDQNGDIYFWGQNTFIGGKRPSNPVPYTRWYDTDKNFWYQYVSNWTLLPTCICGWFNAESNKIITFNKKQVFRAVDYSDTNFVADNATPSAKYKDLDLPTSAGQTYVAPGDGYFVLRYYGNENGFIRLECSESKMANSITNSNNQYIQAACSIPCAKGQTIAVWYSSSMTAFESIRFVYLKGCYNE